MPQQDLLFPWRTVEENLCLPMELQGGISKEEQHRLALKALEDVGLTGTGDKRPSELSGGMRQRAAFARTLLSGSELLLLDEPFSALDYLTRIEMREWLRKDSCRREEPDHKADRCGDSAGTAPYDREPGQAGDTGAERNADRKAAKP